MKISGIDESFVSIIDYLSENGFKTIASCDGVLAHHENVEGRAKPTFAYISFLKSDRIIDVMAALLRDKDNFFIILSNDTSIEPMELYGNEMQGTQYAVHFENLQDQLSEYFERIVRGVIDGTITVSDEEKEQLIKIEKCLEQTEDSELNITFSLNGKYQPYTGKSGRTNTIIIRTKDGLDYERNIAQLAQMISKEFGIELIEMNYGEDNTEFFKDKDEFIVAGSDKCSLEYNFKDEDLPKALQILEFAKTIENSLETMEYIEPEYDDDYFDDIIGDEDDGYYDGDYDDIDEELIAFEDDYDDSDFDEIDQ